MLYVGVSRSSAGHRRIQMIDGDGCEADIQAVDDPDGVDELARTIRLRESDQQQVAIAIGAVDLFGAALVQEGYTVYQPTAALSSGSVVDGAPQHDSMLSERRLAETLSHAPNLFEPLRLIRRLLRRLHAALKELPQWR